MEAFFHIDEIEGPGPFKGYRILIITYVVGSFAFQATFPRWKKRTRQRPSRPVLEITDLWSAPIWPGVTVAYWPPPGHISRSSLDDFRKRFNRVPDPQNMIV